MFLDCFHRDEEAGGDLLVAESSQDQVNDFGFARRYTQGSEHRIQVRVPGLERTLQGTSTQEMSEVKPFFTDLSATILRRGTARK